VRHPVGCLIGRKVGMTQVFGESGRVSPVTVIEAGPCVVVQRKSEQTDGYSAVQLGLVEPGKTRHTTKPMLGHFKKAELPPCRVLREVRLDEGAQVKVGDRISVADFAPGERVTIVGTSKGKGFQGVMKRHNFSGGKASHGSMFHRAPGSIGQSAYPSRVLKGMRGPGHMGSERVTVKNLEVVRVDPEGNTLLVRGAVPGAGGGYVLIRKTSGSAARGGASDGEK